MELDIEICPLEVFEVKINGKGIGQFRKESSWEGMIKLSGENGVIIARDENSLVDKIFSGVLGSEKQSSYDVVSITQDLIPVKT